MQLYLFKCNHIKREDVSLTIPLVGTITFLLPRWVQLKSHNCLHKQEMGDQRHTKFLPVSCVVN